MEAPEDSSNPDSPLLSHDKPEDDESVAVRTTRRHGAAKLSLSNRLTGIFRAVICAAAVALVWWHVSRRPAHSPPPYHRRVLLYAGQPGPEGIGSVMQRFKGLIVFAEANNMDLVMTDVHSSHGYITSDILNPRHPNETLPIRLPACLLQSHIGKDDMCEYATKACGNFSGSEWDVAAQANLGTRCQTFVYADNGQVCFSELMNECTRDWVRHHLLASSDQTSTMTKGQVGIHIRWADAGFTQEKFSGTFRGSMSVANMNLVVGRLREAGKVKSIKVLTKDLPDWVLSQLDFDFELVGGEEADDDVSAARSLAESEYLLLGGSSYGVVIAQVSSATTIFTEDARKYDGFDKLGIRVLTPSAAVDEI